MMQDFSSLTARCWLAIAASMLVMQTAPAQQSQADVEALLQQQQQEQQRARIESEIQQLGQQPKTEVLPRTSPPSELRTDLPPMTESATSAAELLGTAYRPGKDAMFGEQLFQPGIAQT
jgi:hemolysin activation/secretion protein